jgi:lysozyme
MTSLGQKPTQQTFKAEGNHLQIAINIIKHFEGCKLEAYQDSVKVWTIGYGHTKTAKEGMKITQEEAEKLLIDEITEYENAVLKFVDKICNDNQIASLISFSYNLGIEKLRTSTLLKVIKENPANFIQIREEFMRWIYAGGKILKGLQTRREAEADLYCK